MYGKFKNRDGFKVDPFCSEQGFNRFSFFDYIAGRHEGKVSAEMRERIELAISSEYGRRFAIEVSSKLSLKSHP